MVLNNEQKELYEKLITDLKSSEETYQILKQNKESKESKYQSIKKELDIQRETLKQLSYQKEVLPQSNYFKINLIIAILSAIIILLLVILYGNITKTLSLLIFETIKGTQVILFQVISLTIGLPIILKIENKIKKKIKQISSNKIISSEEYQELLRKIENLEKDIQLNEQEKSNIEKEMINIQTKYNNISADVTTKRALINIIKNEMNTNHQQQPEKSYTRRKINANKQII